MVSQGDYTASWLYEAGLGRLVGLLVVCVLLMVGLITLTSWAGGIAKSDG